MDENNVMAERCPNQSTMIIKVNTKFKHQHDSDGNDLRSEFIKAFHNKVFGWVEAKLTDNEDLEAEIVNLINDEQLGKPVEEFSDLGEVSIQLWEQEHVQVNQKDEDKEMIVDDHSLQVAAAHPAQKKLNEM